MRGPRADMKGFGPGLLAFPCRKGPFDDNADSPLTWDVYVTQPEPTVDPDLPPGARQRLFSPVTATFICGHRDAILVDALLTLDQARRLAGWIAAHRKNLTSVYITHAHGDH